MNYTIIKNKISNFFLHGCKKSNQGVFYYKKYLINVFMPL